MYLDVHVKQLQLNDLYTVLRIQSHVPVRLGTSTK